MYDIHGIDWEDTDAVKKVKKYVQRKFNQSVMKKSSKQSVMKLKKNIKGILYIEIN